MCTPRGHIRYHLPKTDIGAHRRRDNRAQGGRPRKRVPQDFVRVTERVSLARWSGTVVSVSSPVQGTRVLELHEQLFERRRIPRRTASRSTTQRTIQYRGRKLWRGNRCLGAAPNSQAGRRGPNTLANFSTQLGVLNKAASEPLKGMGKTVRDGRTNTNKEVRQAIATG